MALTTHLQKAQDTLYSELNFRTQTVANQTGKNFLKHTLGRLGALPVAVIDVTIETLKAPARTIDKLLDLAGRVALIALNFLGAVFSKNCRSNLRTHLSLVILNGKLLTDSIFLIPAAALSAIPLLVQQLFTSFISPSSAKSISRYELNAKKELARASADVVKTENTHNATEAVRTSLLEAKKAAEELKAEHHALRISSNEEINNLTNTRADQAAAIKAAQINFDAADADLKAAPLDVDKIAAQEKAKDLVEQAQTDLEKAEDAEDAENEWLLGQKKLPHQKKILKTALATIASADSEIEATTKALVAIEAKLITTKAEANAAVNKANRHSF